MTTTAPTTAKVATCYQYGVAYTKHFTGGLLAGLTYDEVRKSFDMQDATEWANEYDGWHCANPCGGSSPYRIEVTGITKRVNG